MEQSNTYEAMIRDQKRKEMQRKSLNLPVSVKTANGKFYFWRRSTLNVCGSISEAMRLITIMVAEERNRLSL